MRGIEQFLQVDAATLGALKYAGTWNASTNTPTLASGVGVQGQYYVVSVAGSTNLDGETNWQVGDWAVFNGSVWQKVDGGSTGLLTTLTVTGNTFLATTSGDVGIGTSSPDAKLRVNGAAKIGEGAASNTSKLMVNTVSGVAAGIQLFQDANESWIIQNPASTTALTFANSGTERMRITAGGDVGIGVTPMATGANGSQLQIGSPTVTSGAGLTIGCTTTADIQFSDATSGTGQYAGLIRYSHANDSMGFWTASAERLRIDASGNLGLGVTPSAWISAYRALDIGNTASVYGRTDSSIEAALVANAYRNSAGNWIYRLTDVAGRFGYDSIGSWAWFTAPSGTAGNAITFTQAMTLDASGDFIVGGTTTNSIRLTAEKSNPSRGIIAHVSNTGSSSLTGSQIMFTQNTVNNWAIGQPAGVDAFAFWSSRNTAADGTERMRIDSSGNLGLGVTPSAWGTLKGFDISSGGALFGYTAQVGLANNAYYDGSSWRYKNTDAAAFFRANALGFEWHTAPSGTAGNAISFTQAMTLDASGNLLVGATSNPGVLNTTVVIDSGANSLGGVVIQNNTTGRTFSDGGHLYMSGAEMRLYNAENNVLMFGTNNTERARITSGGDLLVGTTSNTNTAKVFSLATASGPAFACQGYSGDVAAPAVIFGKYDNDSTTSQIFVRFTINNNSAGSGQINANGASAAAFGSYSDVRLKENISNLPSQLGNICALRPVEFDYKDGSGHQIGFVAQEMQQVYPDVVAPGQDEMLMVTGWSKTEARLVKAIQEQQAIIESLKARLDAANL